METDVPLPLDTPPAPPPAPIPTESAPPAPEPAPDLSVKDHEAANPAKSRHRRARSHDAGPDDVPRIAALTKKLRETEAELAAARTTPASSTPSAPAAPPASATVQAAPTPAPVAHAPAPVAAVPVRPADDDPEPDAADYVNDPSRDYVKDVGRWSARQAIREENERVATQAAQTRERDYWLLRETDAKKQHPDFEAVAYIANSPIPKGSLVDRFVRESAAGLHVLYHLHKNRAELDAMLALPLFDPATNRYPQVDALSQLALRLSPNGNGRSSAAGTGSAVPPPLVTKQPRPPNPVRTGPLTPGNELPGDNASISEHEKIWNQRRR